MNIVKTIAISTLASAVSVAAVASSAGKTDEARPVSAPTMQGQRGAMPMMNVMVENQAMMQEHMRKMEAHMSNIEALLKQLVALQRK